MSLSFKSTLNLSPEHPHAFEQVCLYVRLIIYSVDRVHRDLETPPRNSAGQRGKTYALGLAVSDLAALRPVILRAEKGSRCLAASHGRLPRASEE